MSLSKIANTLLDRHESGLTAVFTGIEEKFARGWSNPSNAFSVSQLFFCPRKAFLARAGVPDSPDLSSALKMSVGTFLHEIIQDSMDKHLANYGFRELELYREKLSVRGHIDGALLEEGTLIEIKTMASNGVQKAIRVGMPPYYQKQANLYCYLWNKKYKKKLTKIKYIVLDRDSMDMMHIPDYDIDIPMQNRIVDDLKNYCAMWERGAFPYRAGMPCSICSLKSLCNASNSLKDYLVGGKLRKSNA
jgi:CRISPR/Cas system-associated exonuclease Cas4 (RecB family)